MKITLINPNNATQKGDFFGTGIPYMPIGLAYAASYLREKKYDIEIIDAFGEAVFQKRAEDGFIIQGLSLSQIIRRIDKGSLLICIYAGHVVEHDIIINIVKEIKKNFKIPIAIIENSQSVTSYSLVKSKEKFFKEGVDFIIYGEPEITMEELIEALIKSRPFSKINGLIYKDKKKIMTNSRRNGIERLDSLPFPAWDLLPIQNYWKLGYAHAPFKESYLPIITSRGCVYNCQFCIIPFVNQKKWRPRSAKNVFEEIRFFIEKYKIKEFHFEDLNPTIDKNRIKELCKLIIGSKMDIKLKFASGTKIETLDKETIYLLARAGCNYISFSPESGSKKVLELMKKPFDHEFGILMAEEMSQKRIKSQACFVLGFPGETVKDLRLTRDYIIELTKAGVDEIALFIMAPIPGSKPYDSWQFEDLSNLTFSPVWRSEYRRLHNFRKKMYMVFFLYKLIYHPFKTLKQPFNILLKQFETKMEMTIYRRMKV